MTVQVMNDVELWFDAYRLRGYMNAAALDDAAEIHDTTAFGDAGRRRLSGLRSIALSMEGFHDSTADGILYNALGVAGKPVSIAPLGGTAGNLAYLFRALSGEYQPGNAAVGEPLKFSVKAEGSEGEPLVRGILLYNATAVASGNGSGFQHGALASGKNLYAALHVLAISGTLDAVVQSDDNGSFTTPTNRITFAQQSAIGSAWATPVAGPITDDYWRINLTLGGGSPSAQFLVTLGFAD